MQANWSIQGGGPSTNFIVGIVSRRLRGSDVALTVRVFIDGRHIGARSTTPAMRSGPVNPVLASLPPTAIAAQHRVDTCSGYQHQPQRDFRYKGADSAG